MVAQKPNYFSDDNAITPTKYLHIRKWGTSRYQY
jgi:hypothetical protein